MVCLLAGEAVCDPACAGIVGRGWYGLSRYPDSSRPVGTRPAWAAAQPWRTSVKVSVPRQRPDTAAKRRPPAAATLRSATAVSCTTQYQHETRNSN